MESLLPITFIYASLWMQNIPDVKTKYPNSSPKPKCVNFVRKLNEPSVGRNGVGDKIWIFLVPRESNRTTLDRKLSRSNNSREIVALSGFSTLEKYQYRWFSWIKHFVNCFWFSFPIGERKYTLFWSPKKSLCLTSFIVF